MLTENKTFVAYSLDSISRETLNHRYIPSSRSRPVKGGLAGLEVTVALGHLEMYKVLLKNPLVYEVYLFVQLVAYGE
jgi:hypothetical protein